MADAAAPGDGGGKSEKKQISARYEGVGQAIFFHLKSDMSRQRGLADLAQHAEIDEMVLAQLPRPLWEAALYLGQNHQPLIEFDAVALPVVESHRLDMLIALERPGKTGGGILSTGKHNDG